MKTKKKSCQGSSAVSVKGCGALSYWRKYGLCRKCYTDWLLNTEDGKEKLKKTTLKATRESRELRQAERRSKEVKSLNYLLINVRTIVHEYIRLRDKHKPCISCGAKWHKDFQAGHFYKSELYSSMRFDAMNIHGQCPKCNMYLEGNLNQYDQNLIKRIGKEEYEALKLRASKDKKNNFKWDRDTLEEIRKTFKELIKSIDK